MVYDNIGHGADHCFPPPGYKRPKSMKRTDGVGPVGRRTNGRRTVCGKDVRAAASALCSQRLLLLRLFVRACVQPPPPCAVRPCVLPLRPFVRAAASAVCSPPRAAAASVRACSRVVRARCCLCRVQSARSVRSLRTVGSAHGVPFRQRRTFIHFRTAAWPFTFRRAKGRLRPFVRPSKHQAPSAKCKVLSAKCGAVGRRASRYGL